MMHSSDTATDSLSGGGHVRPLLLAGEHGFFEADAVALEETPHRTVPGVNAPRPQLRADLLDHQTRVTSPLRGLLGFVLKPFERSSDDLRDSLTTGLGGRLTNGPACHLDPVSLNGLLRCLGFRCQRIKVVNKVIW